MSDTQNTPDLTPEAAAARHQQDLECLTLLQQAQELRMETDYVDRMIASLRGDVGEPPVEP